MPSTVPITPLRVVRGLALKGRALVTGATGFVGSHVVRSLLSRGVRVRALVRPGTPAERLQAAGVEIAEGDLLNRDSVLRALEDCDFLFHVAALYAFSHPDPTLIYRTNVDGTRTILEAARHVRRIVYTSTVGALGCPGDGRPANEYVPVRERDLVGAYKKSKFRAQVVAEELAALGYPIVIVNPTTPVGPGDVKPTPTGRMIVDYMAGKMKAYVETGLNLVAVEDVAEGHCRAAERGRIGERYILGSANLHLRDIFQALGEITGVPAPKLRVPRWVPLGAALLSTAAARCMGRSPALSFEQVRLSSKFMYFDGRKAVEDLGMPQSCVYSALERAVDWFRRKELAKIGLDLASLDRSAIHRLTGPAPRSSSR
ncbi:MAG: NAD-dependent epimerase/dehydratase family protein [Planctomycetaceae bacterium]|nr:NAD-dependent epimerase/dehydratase family protein [Planctomycetaceae bacterium]